MGSLGDYLKNQEPVLHLFIDRVGGQTVDWRLLTVIYCDWNSFCIASELEVGQNLTVRVSIPLSNSKTPDKRTQDSLEITNMKIWKNDLQWTTFHQEKNFLMQSNAIFTVLSRAIIELVNIIYVTSITRLNSGIFRIFELREWNLNLNNSDNLNTLINYQW